MRIKNILLVVAIGVLTIFVMFYGINTLFPKANYEDYCGDVMSRSFIPLTEQDCLSMEGVWEPQDIKCVTEPCPDGYCDLYSSCQREYDQANAERSRGVFFLAIPLGVILIILGMFVFHLESVGAGLVFGGIGTLVYGSGAYWPYTENWIRFLISLVGLVVLIYLVYYFNPRAAKRKRKKGKR